MNPDPFSRDSFSAFDARFNRRGFLRVVGLGTAALAAGRLPAMAEPFVVPADKKLTSEWIASLYARGDHTVYRGGDLKLIGMPVGGLCAGQVYLGGDGKLWHWDIFNVRQFSIDNSYQHPWIPSSPFDQGFSLQIKNGPGAGLLALDSSGFTDISFNGEYPLGFVEYKHPHAPITVSLEAFSPFTPLATDDSSIPATVMRYTIHNNGTEPIDAAIIGHLQNAVVQYSGANYTAKGRRNRLIRQGDLLVLECSVETVDVPLPATQRPPIVFADFEGPDYGDWKVEGDAFGKGPVTKAPPPQNIYGFQGKSFVDSFTADKQDGAQGKLTSPEFAIERAFINFLIGGGAFPETALHLIIDGQVVRSASGQMREPLEWAVFDVREFEGKKAHIEIVDHSTQSWGHIQVDQIQFEDVPRQEPVTTQSDCGSMTLALLQAGPNDTGSPDGSGKTDDARQPISPLHNLVGTVTSSATIQPGGAHTSTFAITWHFPNLGREKIIGDAGSGPKNQINHNSLGRHYATKFKSASDVVSFVSDNFRRLYGQTKLWHDTWYDSTLPYWLLDRTLLNISTLATSTAYRFADGRFYGYEGVEFGQGTPTHVWHYEQAMGRLFPEFDRLLRERVDFNPDIAFRPDGSIMFRGELDGYPSATDGQAGTILRAYRDHQTSPDDVFLKRNWPSIKLAMQWMIGQDGNADGIIECGQHNTQDVKWWGAVPWISGLYLAALRACEEMAGEMDDADAGKKYRTILEAGQKNFVSRLWDEGAQYFIQLPAAGHEHDVGSYQGCEADQVFGQHWAHQLGLGRIFPEEKTKAALASLWKYNFTPDVGVYRARPENASGRWFAMAGEACLLICTFPQGKPAGLGGWPANYFNENWGGIEHQVAGHMIWEGLVQEGLAVERALHDRYHASKHNPWNEVEWGDHYARSMASYGVFTAVCGFEYHGPKGTMAFAPRLTPEDFRAAFTGAEGWGSYAQTQDGDQMRASIELKWGRLDLQMLTLTPVKPSADLVVTATLDGREVPVQARLQDERAVIHFSNRLALSAGQKLNLALG